MPNPKPQLGVPRDGSRVAIGAASRFPIVLVECTGALGVLVAERCCTNETLKRVLYFRALMEQPYAKFFEGVELLTVDGFFVARVTSEDAVFYEPSSVPYAIENLTRLQYDQFVDDVVAYRTESIFQLVSIVFSRADGFSIDSGGRLTPPAEYANGMSQFLSKFTFVEPNEPITEQD